METTSLVKQIHREFKEAVNSSDVQNLIKDISEDKKLVVDKANEYKNKLTWAGLTNSKSFLESKKIVDKKISLDSHNGAVKELLENQVILPNRRLIGLKQLFEICKKYDLYIANISQYTGDIPENNLNDIIEFEKELPNSINTFKFEFGFWDKFIEKHSFRKGGYNDKDKLSNHLLIVAPYDLLNINPLTHVLDRIAIDNNILQDKPSDFEYKFEMPKFNFLMDPIILFPSVSNELGYFFNIVTAWGDEAEDEYVTSKIKMSDNNLN